MVGFPVHILVGDREYDKMEVETWNDCNMDFEVLEEKLAYEKSRDECVVELIERFKPVEVAYKNL